MAGPNGPPGIRQLFYLSVSLTFLSQVSPAPGVTTARMAVMALLADVVQPVKWVFQAPVARKVKSAPLVRMAGCMVLLARPDPQGMINADSCTSNKLCFTRLPQL